MIVEDPQAQVRHAELVEVGEGQRHPDRGPLPGLLDRAVLPPQVARRLLHAMDETLVRMAHSLLSGRGGHFTVNLLPLPTMPLSSTKIKVGDPAPDIFLTAANGHEISLRAALLEGPVLVEFIRGTWCPSAQKRMEELNRARAAFRDARTRVMVVAGEDPAAARRYFAEHPTPLTVLLDGERAVVRSFGVHQRFGMGAWNVARPASFLIDRAGFVRLVHVARLPTESLPVAEIL